MNNLEEKFDILKNSKESEELNDFLIEIGKHPKSEYLPFIKYFIEHCDPMLLNQLKLNLIYALGEVGTLKKIDDDFLDYLIKEYYNSDRWVRGEIINTLDKISVNISLGKNVIKLLGTASNEEYVPNAILALRVLSKLNTIPKVILRNIFNVFNSSNFDLKELSSIVLIKIVKNEEELIECLLQNDNYKILKKNAIRSLLILYFRSSSNIEAFSQIISDSEMDSIHKEIFLNELETYKRILLKIL